MIWFSSDFHFCHELPSLYTKRGFSNVGDMNNAIVKKWNELVKDDDEVYVLGDIMLSDNEKGISCFRQLNGNFHIVLGNHDTDVRATIYRSDPKVLEVVYATIVKYNGFHFYLSHYPTFTGHCDNRPLKGDLICLYGHTHQASNFYIYPDTELENIRMYHVGLDSHDLCPVSIEDVIRDLCEKAIEKGKKVNIPKIIQTKEEQEKEKAKQQERKKMKQKIIEDTIEIDIVKEEYQKLSKQGLLPQLPTGKDMNTVLLLLPKCVIERYEKDNPAIFLTLNKDKDTMIGKKVLSIIKTCYGI